MHERGERIIFHSPPVKPSDPLLLHAPIQADPSVCSAGMSAARADRERWTRVLRSNSVLMPSSNLQRCWVFVKPSSKPTRSNRPISSLWGQMDMIRKTNQGLGIICFLGNVNSSKGYHLRKSASLLPAIWLFPSGIRALMLCMEPGVGEGVVG